MLRVYLLLLLGTISCANVAGGTKLAQFQAMQWPQYTKETYTEPNGGQKATLTETHLESGNRLVRSTMQNGGQLVDVCTALLREDAEHDKRTCVSPTGIFEVVNSFDDQGRPSSVALNETGQNFPRTGSYEYSGTSEVFRSYLKGSLQFTVLGEQIGARKRYTTWYNEPAKPAIHVRNYEESGEGHEIFVSGGPDGAYETSETRIFKSDNRKITLTAEVSRDYPAGIIFGTVRSWTQETSGYTEENFKIAPQDIDLSKIKDFDTAAKIIPIGVKYRHLTASTLKPSI